jgi:outer membrane protein TolC
MHRTAVGFAALLWLLAPVAASGQEPLTLGQAVARARGGNRALSAATSRVEEARAEARATRGDLWPRITVAESWQRGDQPVFVFSSLLSARRFAVDNLALVALSHPEPTGLFRTTVAAEQVLFDGGRRRASAVGAGIRVDIAAMEAEVAAADLVVEVTRTFGGLLAAEAARASAEAGVAAAREDHVRAERLRDAGMATEADVLGLAVHVAELRERASRAGADAVGARAALNRLMAVPPERVYDVREPVLDDLAPVPPLDGLLAAARRDRPSLRRAEAAARLAESARRGARAAFVPQIAAQAAIEVSGTRLDERASSWLIGGELRWSLSTGGSEAARLKGATEALGRARMERDDAVAQVEVEVVAARAGLEAARARVELGRVAVAQARESQRIVRDRFEAGLAGTSDVLRASSAVLDAEARRVAAIVDVLVSRTELDRATGRTP